MGIQRLHADSGVITTVASAGKTFIQLVAATHVKVEIERIDITFFGILGTDPNVQIKVLYQTTAGSSTGTGVPTIGKWDSLNTETPQTSLISGPASGAWTTSEPTASDIIENLGCHPQSRVSLVYASGELVVKGGGRLGVMLTETTATTHNALISIKFKE